MTLTTVELPKSAEAVMSLRSMHILMTTKHKYQSDILAADTVIKRIEATPGLHPSTSHYYFRMYVEDEPCLGDEPVLFISWSDHDAIPGWQAVVPCEAGSRKIPIEITAQQRSLP
jgi:hypothetical protein